MTPLRSLAIILMSAFTAHAAEPILVNLMPGDLPAGAIEGETARSSKAGAKPDPFIGNVTWPTLTVHLPEPSKATGAAVVICPGGAYAGLAIAKEGHDVAKWLNTLGVAGVVLKYRMPKPAVSKDDLPYPTADARMAIRMVRSKAAEWKIDPQRVGIMGFSAGGHLAATTATQWDDAKPYSTDPLEHFSTRPDFAILAYPVISFTTDATHTGSMKNLLGDNPSEDRIKAFSAELRVTPQTPPTFLVHAKDDHVKVENSELFAAACKKSGVPVETMLLTSGGHGFGLGVSGGEPAAWPAKCAQWMKDRGLLTRR